MIPDLPWRAPSENHSGPAVHGPGSSVLSNSSSTECVFMKTWKELGFSRENLESPFGKWRPGFKEEEEEKIRIFQFHLSPRDAALVCITPRCACKGASVDSLLILVLVRPGQTNKRGLKSKSTHSQTGDGTKQTQRDSRQQPAREKGLLDPRF